MFDVYVVGVGEIHHGETCMCSLPRRDIEKSLQSLDRQFGEWIITKCTHENLKVHIEKYQVNDRHENFKMLNFLARDYNVLLPHEKDMIIALSNEGKDFEEIVGEIVDEKVRRVAMMVLNNPIEMMKITKMFEDMIES